jgi:S1-C subfamily serine protease
MKKILVTLLILLSIGTAYGATYTLVSANYPILVNGQKIAVQPLNYNGTTYLPLRSISEAVGVPIEWNSAKKSVEITTVDVDRLKEASVMILAENDRSTMQGSGVYIDYDEVLTANHISEGRTDIKTSDGTTLTVEDSDKTIDAAILEPSKKATPVKIGNSDEIAIGDKVVVIASPKGNEDTVVYATVIGFDPQGIVIKTTLGGGASGGAVFDMNGSLIGIVIAADGTSQAVETKQLISPINAIREKL